jgi:DNA polymerase-3 subunit gamma/tau
LHKGALLPKEIIDTAIKEVSKTIKTKNPSNEEVSIEKQQVVSTIKTTGKVPGLSLASLRKKAAIKKAKEAEVKEKLPIESFTIEQFQKTWNEYVALLVKNNKHIVHALLSENTPILKGTEIHLTFYNETMKNDLLYEKLDLMNFIREKLKNYDIELVIHVDEQQEQKFVYTTQEKYEFLANKNNALAMLKKEFNLDVS